MPQNVLVEKVRLLATMYLRQSAGFGIHQTALKRDLHGGGAHGGTGGISEGIRQ